MKPGVANGVGVAKGEAVGVGVGEANGVAGGVGVGVAVGLYFLLILNSGCPFAPVPSMYESVGRADTEAVANSTAVAPVGKSV